jgi:hypothetical protein
MELAAAKRRIRQLETELAVSRKVNEVFLEKSLPPKRSLPGDRVPDPAGDRRAASLPDARRVRFGLLRLEDASSVGEDAQARVACR